MLMAMCFAHLWLKTAWHVQTCRSNTIWVVIRVWEEGPREHKLDCIGNFWLIPFPYHIIYLRKPDCPAEVLLFDACVWGCTQKHIHVCLCVLCASHQKHAWDKVNKNTHLVSFRMPGILCLLGSDYFPSPHAGSAGEQINYAAQHNVSLIQHWKGVGWQGLEVKLNLQAGSGCRQASS